ncbi:MAG TPA: LysM peptidoglycan-binding domain-containing protein, partial [Chryseolinea sp.]|nr:LysM peptidoglycan-binding domain-containing protein [Chryseolinea sp.]
MIHELIIAGASFFHPPTPLDSIGIETINGKVFVIHQVGEKETLYGISKRYGTTVDIILQYNPTADGGLEIGQILKVPYTPRPKSQPAATGGGFIHVVAAKEG